MKIDAEDQNTGSLDEALAALVLRFLERTLKEVRITELETENAVVFLLGGYRIFCTHWSTML